jgi:hypothetical protein
MSSYVYFLRPVGQSGPIKIGYSVRPEKRREYFNAWSPIPLELVHVIRGGGEALETKLHLAFADAHSHSEWFVATPRLLDMLGALQDGVPVDEIDLRPTGRLKHRTMGRAAWSEESKRRYSKKARQAEQRGEVA